MWNLCAVRYCGPFTSSPDVCHMICVKYWCDNTFTSSLAATINISHPHPTKSNRSTFFQILSDFGQHKWVQMVWCAWLVIIYIKIHVVKHLIDVQHECDAPFRSFLFCQYLPTTSTTYQGTTRLLLLTTQLGENGVQCMIHDWGLSTSSSCCETLDIDPAWM